MGLGAICLVTLVVGMTIEGGATMVGVAVVAGVLSLVALADGTFRRLRERSGPRAAG